MSCPFCGASEYSEVKRFTDPPVIVGRCDGCGLLYTPTRHPHPTGLLTGTAFEDLRVLYRPIVERRKAHYRSRNFAEYLRIIEAHTGGRRLLDVGCAHGFLLDMARTRGWDTLGVEPSQPMASFARGCLGLEVLGGSIGEVDLGEREFDAITFTDSAEYLPDPMGDLRAVVARLAPGGVLLLKVPNGDYFRLRHWLERSARVRIGDEAFGPPQRFVHYTLHTLRRLSEALGLQTLTVRSCRPVDSTVWWDLVGLPLDVETPLYLDLRGKVLRRVLHALGRFEETLTGQNHFSPAIYVLARVKP